MIQNIDPYFFRVPELQRWAREGLGRPLRGPGGRDTVPREQPQGLKKASVRVMAAAEEGHLHSGRR